LALALSSVDTTFAPFSKHWIAGGFWFVAFHLPITARRNPALRKKLGFLTPRGRAPFRPSRWDAASRISFHEKR
jgi:hypothetical protein